jgi:hypothetical protein
MNYTADKITLTLQALSTQATSLNMISSKVTLVLDRQAESSFIVLGQNNNWVNGVFNRFNGILSKLPRRNIMVHNVLYDMTVQLVAVIVITTFSIFAANRLTAMATIQYSEVYIFIVVFLLLSNAWTYISRGLIAVRSLYYPIVDIRRHLGKRILLSIFNFVILAAAAWAIGYVLDLLIKR